MNDRLFSLSAFLYGLPVGFAFSIALGPIFFSLIKASLENGFRSAMYIAIGVVFADAILLGIAYGGVEAIIPQKLNMDIAFWVQLFGGFILISLGVHSILKKEQNTEGVVVLDKSLIFKNIAQGFFLNMLNPTNFFEWVGTAGILKTKYEFETYENVSFFTAALLAVFCTELAVAYFASRLRHILNERVMRFINVSTGLVFVGFGIWLLFMTQGE